jgi:hypothetical protein
MLPAAAHAHLVSATPAADASARAVTALVLHFTEVVEPAFTGVVLKTAAGAIVGTGAAKAEAADPTTIDVPIPAPLAPGRYEVDWHALAVDGHKTTGTYAFTVTP